MLRRGNYAEYTAYMLKKYGQGVIDELLALKRKPVKFTAADLELMIEDIKSKLEKLNGMDNPTRIHSTSTETPR